jgi:hypothetical protein
MSKRDVYKQMVPCGKIQLVYHADWQVGWVIV